MNSSSVMMIPSPLATPNVTEMPATTTTTSKSRPMLVKQKQSFQFPDPADADVEADDNDNVDPVTAGDGSCPVSMGSMHMGRPHRVAKRSLSSLN